MIHHTHILSLNCSLKGTLYFLSTLATCLRPFSVVIFRYRKWCQWILEDGKVFFENFKQFLRFLSSFLKSDCIFKVVGYLTWNNYFKKLFISIIWTYGKKNVSSKVFNFQMSRNHNLKSEKYHVEARVCQVVVISKVICPYFAHYKCPHNNSSLLGLPSWSNAS